MRTVTAAFAARDFDALTQHMDPDVEWHGTVGGVEEGHVYRGREQVIAAFNDYFATWERIHVSSQEYIDPGGEDVVVFHHEVAKGRESGLVVESDTASIQTVRDGKVVRVRTFMDREEARRAAGLGG